jgi:hypothetical protein
MMTWQRRSDKRLPIKTIADTGVQLLPQSKRFRVFTGTAVCYGEVLPDARLLPIGTPFVFENQSTNFVGLRNSDSTMWARFAPRCTATLTLTDNSTAAGVWHWTMHDPAIGNPAFGMNATMDFNCYPVSNQLSADPQLRTVVNGTAAAVTFDTVSEGGKQGTLKLTTGTDTTGYALGYTAATQSYLGGGCRAVEGLFSVSALSAVAEEYIARFGFGDNVSGGAHTNGCYFLYDRLTYGDLWVMRCINAGGNETIATAVAPTAGATGAEWQKLRVEIDALDERADFWIGKTKVSAAGGLATRMPLTSTAMKILNIGITKSAGGTARYLKVDLCRLQSYPINTR